MSTSSDTAPRAANHLNAEDVARLIKDRFDVHIEIDTEVETPTERARPFTKARVAKLLERLDHELSVMTSITGIRVVGDNYHLIVTPAGITNVAGESSDGASVEFASLMAVPALDPTPQAAVANAARIALFRQQLLETGACDYSAIADGRGVSREAARKFVQRANDRHQIVVVRYNEKVYVPLFNLDEAFDPDPIFRPVIELLHARGETGWASWTYLVTPSTWLDGLTPVEHIRTDQNAVIEATRRRLSNQAA